MDTSHGQQGHSQDLTAIDEPAATLFRAFSRETYVPVESAGAQSEARDKLQSTTTYREIGAGSCGRIFELPYTGYVLKRAQVGFEAQLKQDYLMHTIVRECIVEDAGCVDICVPRVMGYIGEKDIEYWNGTHAMYPADSQRLPFHVLKSERIPPLPKNLRQALIHLFCSDDQKMAALFKPENTDCLVRVCLGELGVAQRPVKSALRKDGQLQTFMSLRNFPLTLDKIKRIRNNDGKLLDPFHWATAIGEALALMHWVAHCDARDVEFVLGGVPLDKAQLSPIDIQHSNLDIGTRKTIEKKQQHNVQLWLLDFNQVKFITMDEEGVKKAVAAFFDNKPKYYPRPCSGDPMMEGLWEEFRASYMSAAQSMGELELELAERVIDDIEGREGKRAKLLQQEMCDECEAGMRG